MRTCLALLAILLATTATAQTAAFDTAVQRAAYRLDVHPETQNFAGEGAAVLQAALDGANYVFVGEQHLTTEIPQVTTALCHSMAAKGLGGLVSEGSPRTAELTQASLGTTDRMHRMQAHLRRYPYSIGFLDIREESDAVDACMQLSGNERFRVWGVDQEFVGSSRWLIDRVQATHPGPHATDALQHLREQVAAGETGAATSSNSSKLLIESITDDEIAAAASLLKTEGSAEAQAIFADLAESHAIYIMSLKGMPESNARRARLLKRNLLSAIDGSGTRQRLLIKLGGYHGYKGFNPLHQRDLGNMVAELADMRGQTSLHILVQGVRGEEGGYGGFGKPFSSHTYDLAKSQYTAWMKPFLQVQTTVGTPVLIDLRRLRFGDARPTQYDQQQLVDGYDLLLLLPETHAAHPIELP